MENPHLDHVNAIIAQAVAQAAPLMCRHHMTPTNCDECNPPKITKTFGLTPDGKVWTRTQYTRANGYKWFTCDKISETRTAKQRCGDIMRYQAREAKRAVKLAAAAV